MESLGNDDVSSPNARKYLVGNDDVKAENARRRYGYCEVTMTQCVFQRARALGLLYVLLVFSEKAFETEFFICLFSSLPEIEKDSVGFWSITK